MTKTEVANLALIRAREYPLSDDVDTSTQPNAELVRNLWEQALRTCLKDIRPQFAQKQQVLTKTTDVPDFDWELVYQLPTDYIEVVKFNGQNYAEYEEFYDILGNKLYTDEDPVNLKYIRYEENVGLYDSKFIEALTYKLAYDIISVRRGDVNLQSDLYKLYGMHSAKASADSGNSRKLPPIRDRVIRGGRLVGVRRRRSTNETVE